MHKWVEIMLIGDEKDDLYNVRMMIKVIKEVVKFEKLVNSYCIVLKWKPGQIS